MTGESPFSAFAKEQTMPEQPVTEQPAAAGLSVSTAWRQDGELPPLLRGKTRARDQALDPLLTGLRVEARYALPADARGVPTDAGEIVRPGEGTVLALETEDGATIVIHADRLAEAVGRLQPRALRDGAVDLTLFREADGDRPITAPWKAVTVLRLPQDALIDEATALAVTWAAEARQATDSALVAKALLWCIESRLVARSGLYRWQERTIAAADHCPPDDDRLEKARAGAPLLLLIHGLGSHAVGSFADLRADDETWQALQARFPGGVFGYEHRTFSQSPLENALELLDALPEGAHVSVLSHGRGGLVGDLLCLGEVAEEAFGGDNLAPARADMPAETDEAREGLRRAVRQIARRIGERRLVVEQNLRVACPARGSRLLSDNLEVALSGFLNLSQWRGGAALDSVGAAAGASGGGTSSAAGTLKRLLLEIAGRRIAPSLIPGLAAMGVDSPLVAFFAHPGTGCRHGIRMAVIAGTASGTARPGRRAADLFYGWRPLDDDGDLVVDAEAMYGGLAPRAGASYVHEQSESLTHFRYFARASIRDAVRDWLGQNPTASVLLPPFQLLDGGAPVAASPPAQSRGGAALPVLILLPDSMGSCLAVNRDPAGIERIWFDFTRLADGQLARLADISDAAIGVDGLWERFYGGLADYLAASHTLIRFPYDWRQPLEAAADALAETVAAAIAASPGQPVRLLAHGAGGLVARALMSRHPASWRAVVDSGGRLLLLGTPNNGEHWLAHSLLGKSAAIRGLERRDARHDPRQLLAIVAGFPGVLSLLPRPSATDSGGDFFQEAFWRELAVRSTDRWYGDGLAAAPDPTRLADAAAFWQKTLPGNTVPNPERVSQVFGQGAQTPCGVARTDGGRLQLLFTGEGDGAVTWASGRLDNVVDSENVWYLPAEHADLVADARYFPALFELLDSGRTRLLGRLPRRRGDSAPVVIADLPPPVIPGEDELARALFGSRPRRRPPSRKAALSVAVRAGDLRFIDQPLLCGHFIGDPIAAAEAELDARLDGRLSERERLGVYAGPIGTSVIVLPPPSDGQSARGSRPGAIIVGLGDFNGQLGVRQISETVRAAVLRLLLRLRDNSANAPQTVHLYSLLVGCNSTAHIGVADSVAAVTCGVLEANRQFAQALAKATGRGVAVESLTFLEIFRDVAISAAHAVAELPQSLAGPLRRLEAQLDVAPVLTIGDGVRERLSVGQGLGYWSRLIVTDADADADTGDRRPAEETRGRRPAGRRAAAEGDSGHLPEALKYVFLSQRARAETLLQQRQPGLIESIVQRQRLVTADNPQLARMLFQLMVPVDYKVVLRERARLLLILDSYTASLPWELLQADDEPLAVKTPMIRQLITSRFRGNVPTAGSNAACLIVSPSTEGFDKRFGGAASRLDKLPAAVAEGEGIRDALREAGWTDIAYCREESDAIDVLGHLYRQPYRLLTICGHGLFAARALDGRDYTGVVLSDGMLLGAVEIGLMEVVPEVVFLGCCHLGSMTHDSQPARLAYSLARELIDSGVRCVLAAGWAVEDKAAKTFATAFFAQLIAGDTYGEAVFAARRATYDRHRGSNTWGAYQAYGDPGYRLGPDSRPGRKKEDVHVAVEELLDRLESRRVRSARTGIDRRPDFAAEAAWVASELARCPAEWRGRPEVQQAIGTLYAGLDGDGFDAARSALLAALQTEDADGRVACRTIEQLAKIEARQGDRLIDQGLHAQGLALIDSAVARLEALERASGALAVNPERAALSASALKRKALVLAGNADTPWTIIAQALALAAAAYFKAGNGGDPREPYHTLNALPLAWLAGTHDFDGRDVGEIARQCGEEARRRFADSQDFWDAACGTDAMVVDWLLGAAVGDVGGRLARAYRQLASEVPHTDSEWQAVRRQLQLLSTFLRRRGRRRDAERATVLERLADLPPDAE